MLWCLTESSDADILPSVQSLFLHSVKSGEHLLLLLVPFALNSKAPNAKDDFFFFDPAKVSIDWGIHDLTIDAPPSLCPSSREIGNSGLELITFHSSHPLPLLVETPGGMPQG